MYTLEHTEDNCIIWIRTAVKQESDTHRMAAKGTCISSENALAIKDVLRIDVYALSKNCL
jgi:hypothetical protein